MKPIKKDYIVFAVKILVSVFLFIWGALRNDVNDFSSTDLGLMTSGTLLSILPYPKSLISEGVIVGVILMIATQWLRG